MNTNPAPSAAAPYLGEAAWQKSFMPLTTTFLSFRSLLQSGFVAMRRVHLLSESCCTQDEDLSVLDWASVIKVVLDRRCSKDTPSENAPHPARMLYLLLYTRK